MDSPRTLCLSLLLWLAALCLFAGCGGVQQSDKSIWTDMSQRAARHQFRPVLFDTGMFRLSGLLRSYGTGEGELVVYIEGDGYTLTRHGQVRGNSTPAFAQGYELALLDPAPQVLYLSRIGQFNGLHTGDSYKKYWTNARFAPEAVQAANLAIDQAKNMTGADKIQLIGFSGGGAIAVLLAAGREDVTSLVTVAALLDTAWWVNSYLPEAMGGNFRNGFTLSLNPVEQAFAITALPQLHFSGSEDTLIPPQMVKQFQRAAGFTDFRQIIRPNDHNKGWTGDWPLLLQQYILPLRERAKLKSAA